MHPYLDWPGPIPFAHRGGTSEPRRTRCRRSSTPFARLPPPRDRRPPDRRRSPDGVPRPRPVAHLRRRRQHRGHDRRGTRRGPGRRPGTIPLMSELLERFRDVRFNIDCKSDAAAGPLAALIRRYEAIDRVCLGAFSHARLTSYARCSAPNCCRAPARRRWRRFASPAGCPACRRVAQVPVRYGAATGPKGVTVVTERFVRNAHRRGCRCTCGRSTIPTRCTGCSTSGSTAS